MFRWGAAFLVLAAGCAQPYPTPTAVIVELHTDGTRTACVPVSAPLAARIGAPVPVSAACSTDPESSSLVYAWSLADAPAGSLPSLGNTDAVTPTFVPDAAGKFRLKLVVSNGVVASPPAFADIEVGVCGGHAPAVELTLEAATTPGAALEVGEVVSLSATVTDADLEPSCAAHAATFRYDWAFTELPAGSRASLNGSALAKPSFVPDVAGEYALSLSVTDPTGRSATAARSFTVAAAPPGPSTPEPACGQSPPTAVGRVLWPGPVAVCGGHVVGLNLEGTDAIELDANASSDRDNRQCGMGQTLGYAWTLVMTPVSGGKSALESADGASTVLRVTSDGVYKVRLVVRDSTGLSSRELFCSVYAGNVGSRG